MKILFISLLLLVGVNARPFSNVRNDIQDTTEKTYTYKAESPLVKGWPVPDTYNEVEIKKFPRHKVAYTEGSRKSLTFMRLFKQIKQLNVEMTSPVVMKVGEGAKANDMQQMAFVYPDSFAGGGNNVKKVYERTVPAQKVYSYVWQGCSCKKKKRKAKEALYDYAQLTGVKLSNFRVLGYNSPSTPDDEKTWEMIASYK